MHEVSVEEMMAARDQRFLRQKKLQQKGRTLICFTLNIAGPIKTSPLIKKAFQEGALLLQNQLKAAGISCLYSEIHDRNSGPEGYFCCNGNPADIKQLMIALEDQNELTRLFDLDVLSPQGDKLSRQEFNLPPRRCLLCENEAAVCARSRRHSIEALSGRSQQIMTRYFQQKRKHLLCQNAILALLTEAAIAPKPGLVDRLNAGAHQDMDLFTFLQSSAALIAPFEQYVEIGSRFAFNQPQALMQALRTAGRQAEARLFQATEGINTHKGANFSFALFLAALGALLQKQQPLCWKAVRQWIQTLLLQEDSFFRPDSYGRRIEKQYQIGGILHEARAGYPSVFETGLPTLKRLRAQGWTLENAALNTLLQLIVTTEDSTLLHHAAPDQIFALQNEIRNFLSLRPNQCELLTFVQQLDQKMSQNHWSPGGSADLLALTLFCYFIERKQHKLI